MTLKICKFGIVNICLALKTHTIVQLEYITLITYHQYSVPCRMTTSTGKHDESSDNEEHDGI